MSKEQKVIFEPHPVSPERKKELRALGYRIVDARFAPQGPAAAPAAKAPELPPPPVAPLAPVEKPTLTMPKGKDKA